MNDEFNFNKIYNKHENLSKMGKSQNSFCALENRHWIQVDHICCLHHYSVGFTAHKDYFDFCQFYFLH